MSPIRQSQTDGPFTKHLVLQKCQCQDFLVVQWLKTLCSQCRGPGSLVRELDPITNAPGATTKSQHSQIDKE